MKKVPVELRPASGARVRVPSSPAGTCPVCLGYGWHIEEVRGKTICLGSQRCRCCDGTGNVNRTRKRHKLAKWVEGQ